MTVALDTNILLDILTDDPGHWQNSLNRVQESLQAEDVIVGEIVIAELSPALADPSGVSAFLEQLGITYQPSSRPALQQAGLAFRRYVRNRPVLTCPQCGAIVPGRQRVLPDFMVGAHALVHAGRLLTRDRGYYRNYFPELVLV